MVSSFDGNPGGERGPVSSAWTPHHRQGQPREHELSYDLRTYTNDCRQAAKPWPSSQVTLKVHDRFVCFQRPELLRDEKANRLLAFLIPAYLADHEAAPLPGIALHSKQALSQSQTLLRVVSCPLVFGSTRTCWDFRNHAHHDESGLCLRRYLSKIGHNVPEADLRLAPRHPFT